MDIIIYGMDINDVVQLFLSKVPPISVEVIAIDEQLIHAGHSAIMFVEHNINKSRYYDWEEANSFLFSNYLTVKHCTE